MGGETDGPTRTAAYKLRQTGLPDLDRQIEFCRAAERSGIDGLLTDVGAAKPDSILLAAALGMATQSIGLIIAFRSAFSSPTVFVQQLNTLSTLIGDRFSLNIVAGHSPDEQRYYGDFLEHDERYARTDEFLAICRAFWAGGEVNFSGKYYSIENGRLNTPFVSDKRSFPEILVGGGSAAARDLAIKHATCWMRMGDRPENLAPSIEPALAAGKDVGLRMSVVVRPTREEAVRAAYSVVQRLEPALSDKENEREFVRKSDSVSIKAASELAGTEWLTPWLWTGAVRYYGAPALALVGTPREVAAALIEYKRAGVSQFILSGWPKLDEMIRFGEEVIPLVRAEEARMAVAAGDSFREVVA
jgi:alkanesulfonate monooxygenase